MYHDPSVAAMWILAVMGGAALAILAGIIAFDMIQEARRKRASRKIGV